MNKRVLILAMVGTARCAVTARAERAERVRYKVHRGINEIVVILAMAVALFGSATVALAADSKKFEIAGFSIGTPSDPGAGQEWWMSYTKPLEISRYALTNELLEHPLVVTILRYSDSGNAKRAFQSSSGGRPLYPQPLKVAHWDAAHRWMTSDSNEDIYLVKNEYLVGLFDLPLNFPPARATKLFETLAHYVANDEPGGATNESVRLINDLKCLPTLR